MTNDPVVLAICAARLKLIAEARGDFRALMDRVREHEVQQPDRFFDETEWNELRRKSQGTLPNEWLFEDPIVREVRETRARLAEAETAGLRENRPMRDASRRPA